MPFENEFASYEPLRRILDNNKIKALQKQLIVKSDAEKLQSETDLKNGLIKKENLPSDFIADYIIAIDGSYHAAKVETGFPGSEIGYIAISAVLILNKKVKNLSKNEFINPKEFRETEKTSSIDTVIPGCNIVLKGEKNTKSSMRRVLFEEMKNTKAFEGGETLLDTYEHLLKTKIQNNSSQTPDSPIDDVDKKITYDYGKYYCPHSGETLYSTDALRLHELMNPAGENGAMYGQIMSMLEKIWLIHILRAFERKNWLHLLDSTVFALDGPLACFSSWSWISVSIMNELERINNIQKKINDKDMLIFGIEKTGSFCNHFEDLDTGTNGNIDIFEKQSAFLVNDNYIKKNIIFSDSKTPYGKGTYFGRKFFYKTKIGYRIVPMVASFSKSQHNPETADISQYPRLADLLNVLEQTTSNRYQNSISSLASAHAEASIPLHLGTRIFDQISREIKSNK